MLGVEVLIVLRVWYVLFLDFFIYWDCNLLILKLIWGMCYLIAIVLVIKDFLYLGKFLSKRVWGCIFGFVFCLN